MTNDHFLHSCQQWLKDIERACDDALQLDTRRVNKLQQQQQVYVKMPKAVGRVCDSIMSL